ncbi:MAG: hypothetical protein RLZZ450_7068 [Pseudomonadota bacterium]|jgi:hypothetical protein
MTLGTEIATLTKVWRRTILLMVPSMLLWVPCLALSVVFFLNDALYRVTLFDPPTDRSLLEEYREAARQSANHDGFSCASRRAPGAGEDDKRDVLLRVIEFVQETTGGRLLQSGRNNYRFILRPVERLDLALLRRGTAIHREQVREHQTFHYFHTGVLEPYCEAQEARAAEGLPALPPIPAYAQARSLLIDAIDKMEATLARYAEVRPWLLAFFYAWIAYSLFGFVCAFYVLRLSKRIKERLSQASAADAAPAR